jgi:hypothetical protein
MRSLPTHLDQHTRSGNHHPGAAVPSPFAAPFRLAYRAAVESALAAFTSEPISWTASSVPTARNIQLLLADALPPLCPAWRAALHDGSAGSPLDGTVGN